MGLIHAADGFLYGLTTTGTATSTTTADRNGVIYRIATDGSNFSMIHSFDGGSGFSNGKEPNRLIEGHDGKLYGSFREFGPAGGGGVFTIMAAIVAPRSASSESSREDSFMT